MLRPRNTAYQRRTQVSQVTSPPAPVGGWDAISPLANMPENRAVVLDNWFPTPSDVLVRNGHVLHAHGMGVNPVETLMVYEGLTSAASKLFAATSGNVYDVTSTG